MPTIVLVDDDRDFASLVSELLRENGWDVVICAEEDDAVRCVREAQPAVVILDVRMRSRESGWHILEQMENAPDLRGIPVIVCSAAVDDMERRAAWMEARGVRRLVKPFDIDDLLTLIARSLNANGDPPQTATNGSQHG